MPSLFVQALVFFLVRAIVVIAAFGVGRLFLSEYRVRPAYGNLFRAIAFTAFAISSILFILESVWDAVGVAALIVETIAAFFLYRSIHTESQGGGIIERDHLRHPLFGFLDVVALAVVLVGIWWRNDISFFLKIGLPVFTALYALVVARHYGRRAFLNGVKRLDNILIALIGICYGGYAVTSSLIREPWLQVPFFVTQTDANSIARYASMVFLGLCGVIIFCWIQRYWHRYPKFKTVRLIFLATFAAAFVGSVFFTFFLFTIVDRDVSRGVNQVASVHKLVLEDRAGAALSWAHVMVDDTRVATAVRSQNEEEIQRLSKEFLAESTLDAVRVYDRSGLVLASTPSTRELNKSHNTDALLAYAITQKTPISSLDVKPGVLAPYIVARAIYPLVQDGILLGAVETEYVFDNAFLDRIKRNTDFEISLSADDIISASTIRQRDGLVTIIGSRESDESIARRVLEKQESINVLRVKDGVSLYEAIIPLQGINAQTIGSITVSHHAFTIVQEAQGQLIGVLLGILLLSIFMADLVVRSRKQIG